MRIYEFGKGHPQCLLLIHPSLVTWDFFERVIPLLDDRYHLLIPALPGYDLEDASEFESVERCARLLADELSQRGIRELKAAYGCSMGGSIVLRMAADNRLGVENYIMDAGICPYELPWLVTRLIALRDFTVMALGKLGGRKLVARAFSSTRYSDEDLEYVAAMFRHCTLRTLWNTFDSCNNYQMPPGVMRCDGKVRYWYGERERKARAWDLRYVVEHVPDTVFKCFAGTDHADLALFHPKRLAQELLEL